MEADPRRLRAVTPAFKLRGGVGGSMAKVLLRGLPVLFVLVRGTGFIEKISRDVCLMDVVGREMSIGIDLVGKWCSILFLVPLPSFRPIMMCETG